MNPAGAAVALITAEHNHMDAEAKALVAELDRGELEVAALILAGFQAAHMFNEACELSDDYEQARDFVSAAIHELALDMATDAP